jgi:uncharacterized membrane protein YhhN
VVGDAALVWDSLFVVGMIAFACGHYYYIIALQAKKRPFLGHDSLYRYILI